MYSVSNDYLTALATDPVHTSVQLRFWIDGELAFTMHDRNIIPNSLTIQKQCMNSDGFGVGGVYAGELNVSIIPDANFDIFDYDVVNAEIRVIYKMGLYKQNNAWVYEDIPLGRFLIDDIDFKSNGIYEITAYDKMLMFDNDLEYNLQGNAYFVISGLCTMCGVTLSTTENTFNGFANHAKNLVVNTIYVDNCRDALAYVCSCIGCFATMGRTGQLEIRPLTLEFISYDDSISRAERISSLAAMGKTRVRRVRANFITEVEDKDGEKKRKFKRYKAGTGRTKGGILDLGDNPVVWKNMQAVVDKLAEEFYSIDYTMATFTSISNPIYDLGDRLRVVHPNGNKTVVILLTAIEWKYHGIQTHKSFGDEKGIKGKSQKSIDATNEVVASNETISVTITINTAADDTVTVTDEDGNVVATVFCPEV